VDVGGEYRIHLNSKIVTSDRLKQVRLLNGMVVCDVVWDEIEKMD
jgi:hypothetical protein